MTGTTDLRRQRESSRNHSRPISSPSLAVVSTDVVYIYSVEVKFAHAVTAACQAASASTAGRTRPLRAVLPSPGRRVLRRDGRRRVPPRGLSRRGWLQGPPGSSPVPLDLARRL